MPLLESSIITAQANLAITADEIIADLQLTSRFCAVENDPLIGGYPIDQVAFNQLLLNLLRPGEASGGLSRLDRSYNGRGAN